MQSLTNQYKNREGLLKAIQSIKVNSTKDYEVVLAWIEFLLSEQDIKNRKSEGVDLTRGQGSSLLLSSLLSALDTSGAQLKQLIDNQSR